MARPRRSVRRRRQVGPQYQTSRGILAFVVRRGRGVQHVCIGDVPPGDVELVQDFHAAAPSVRGVVKKTLLPVEVVSP